VPYRIIGLVLAVLGVVSAALGVASATVWRADSTVTATTQLPSDGPTLVTTGPGVLGLVDDRVSITASAPDGGDVVIAVGRADDVTGWVGDDPVARVTGMSDWSTLATRTTTGETPKSAPDPSTSDMWVASTSGTGKVTLPWTARPGQWAVLVAATGDDAQAPALALTWDREVTTPWLWPLVGIGVVLVVVGLVLLSVGRRHVRDRRQEAVLAAARTTVPLPAAPGAAGEEPAVSTTTTLTRRELREQALREAQNAPRRRGRQRGAKETEDPAAWAGPPAASDEPETSTVAIPVDETAKGAADAWRRRWNVPARIPPIEQQPAARPGAPARPAPAASAPPQGGVAPAPAPTPEQGGAPGAPGWDDIFGGDQGRRARK